MNHLNVIGIFLRILFAPKPYSAAVFMGCVAMSMSMIMHNIPIVFTILFEYRMSISVFLHFLSNAEQLNLEFYYFRQHFDTKSAYRISNVMFSFYYGYLATSSWGLIKKYAHTLFEL